MRGRRNQPARSQPEGPAASRRSPSRSPCAREANLTAPDTALRTAPRHVPRCTASSCAQGRPFAPMTGGRHPSRFRAPFIRSARAASGSSPCAPVAGMKFRRKRAAPLLKLAQPANADIRRISAAGARVGAGGSTSASRVAVCVTSRAGAALHSALKNASGQRPSRMKQ